MFVTNEGQVKLKKCDNVARSEISESLCTSDVMFLSLSFFYQWHGRNKYKRQEKERRYKEDIKEVTEYNRKMW
jgi:hypothetical protein